MPRELHVDVRGVRELKVGMARLARNVEDQADARFKTTADRVAGLVRSRVPHRSGRLASSVVAEAGVRGAGASVTEGAGVPYAGWIEFGGTRGRPYVAEGRYLYPTSRDVGPPLFQRAGEDAAQDAIARTSWPTPSTSL